MREIEFLGAMVGAHGAQPNEAKLKIEERVAITQKRASSLSILRACQILMAVHAAVC